MNERETELCGNLNWIENKKLASYFIKFITSFDQVGQRTTLIFALN